MERVISRSTYFFAGMQVSLILVQWVDPKLSKINYIITPSQKS
jgi:hypothetical protein